MTGEWPPVDRVEAAVRAHAHRVVTRDPAAREDVAAGAELSPPDLLERLLDGQFEGFDLVAHAKIGAHHVFKTRLVGPAIVVVQARWAEDPDGRWRIREAEVARTAARGASGDPLSRASGAP